MENVLVTLRGKPIITTEDLEKEKGKWYHDPMLGSAPDREYFESEAFARTCLECLIRQKIAEEYVISNKINKTSAYQQKLDEAVIGVNKQILYDTVEIPISESEMRTLYESWLSDESYQEWLANRSYEDMKEDLRLYQRRIKFEDCLNKKIEQLKEEFDIKVNEDF